MPTLRIEERNEAVVVYFTGDRIDSELGMGELSNELTVAAGRAAVSKRLVINFQGVAFIWTDVLGKLFVLNRKCMAEGIKLTLCNMSPIVADLFKITRMPKPLAIYEDEATAIAAFDKSGCFE